MRTLIIYSSKYGFTEECVDYLKEGIKCEVAIKDIRLNKQIDLTGYDWIIMGSSVYIGKISKKMKAFAERNIDKLLKRNIALFVCCTTPNDVDKYLSEGFSTKIYEASKYNANFGGKLQRDKLNFFERKITDMISKKEMKPQEILYKNMDSLIEFINLNENGDDKKRDE